MNLVLSPIEFPRALSALSVLIDAYKEMAAKETTDSERAIMTSCATAGEALQSKLRPLFRGDGDASVELLPGEALTLERALRMSAAKWQQMIKPTMPAFQKRMHREEADDVAKLVERLRKEKGLPW